MKRYTVYNPTTGEVLRSGIAPDEQVANQVHEGEALLEVGAPANTYVHAGAFVALPASPAPHYLFNWTTKQWYDPRTVDDLKALKWVEMKQARDAAEHSPLTVGANLFDADAGSQQKIAGAVQLATLAGEDWTIDWTTATNTVATLTAAGMVAVGIALGSRTSAIYAYARTLREAIDAATTVEEVNAVVWSYP